MPEAHIVTVVALIIIAQIIVAKYALTDRD